MLHASVRSRYDSTLSYQSHTAWYDHTHSAVLSDRTPCAIVADGVLNAWGPQIVLPPYNAFEYQYDRGIYVRWWTVECAHDLVMGCTTISGSTGRSAGCAGSPLEQARAARSTVRSAHSS